MAIRQPVRVIATGIAFEQPDDPAESLLRWHEVLTSDLHQQLAAWQAGEALLLTHTAFVEFDDGTQVHRWTGTPQGPFPISTKTSATTELLRRAADWQEDLIDELGISGYEVARFDFYAAPRRIDLADELRNRLLLD